MNELLFFAHTIIVMIGILGAFLYSEQALIALIALYGILANLFVVKQVILFGLHVTASDMYMIGSVCGFNLLQEFHGSGSAQSAIKISFLLLFFYLILSQLHLLFIPSQFDTAHEHFIALFTPMPRIIIASVAVYCSVQSINYKLYSLFKRITQGRFFIARTFLSLILSQVIDTVLFSLIGLYGIVACLWHVILFSLIIKMIGITISAPFIAFARFLQPRFVSDMWSPSVCTEKKNKLYHSP